MINIPTEKSFYHCNPSTKTSITTNKHLHTNPHSSSSLMCIQLDWSQHPSPTQIPDDYNPPRSTNPHPNKSKFFAHITLHHRITDPPTHPTEPLVPHATPTQHSPTYPPQTLPPTTPISGQPSPPFPLSHPVSHTFLIFKLWLQAWACQSAKLRNILVFSSSAARDVPILRASEREKPRAWVL